MGRTARLAVVLITATLATIGIGLAILLAFTPLSELPDTVCSSVWHSSGGCDAAGTRRFHWIIVVGAVTVLLLVVSLTLVRAGISDLRYPGTTVAILLVSVAAALVGAGYLTIGVEHGKCGSTLSRVDPHGDYNPGQPSDCARFYSESRRDAWLLGIAGGFALATAVALQTSRRRTD